MKILIDIGHPAHVHLFKHVAKILTNRSAKVYFTCRDKEFESDLLKSEGFDYQSFGKHYRTKTGKLFGLIKFTIILLRISFKFKPDILISHGSVYAALVGWLIRKPHIALEDSGNMEQVKLYRPFSKVLLIPKILPQDFGKKQIKYPANHELFYLHPCYYIASGIIYKYLGVDKFTHYVIIRFISWKATHDYGQNGFTTNEKYELIDKLAKKVAVFISSEEELPSDLRKYQINIPPQLMHDALANAELVISEGATVASEAGVLGTPSIYVNSIVRYYNEELEQYGLVFNYPNGEKVLSKAIELLDMNYKLTIQKKRKQFISKHINPTQFLVWFIENYPQSREMVEDTEEFWRRFQ